MPFRLTFWSWVLASSRAWDSVLVLSQHSHFNSLMPTPISPQTSSILILSKQPLCSPGAGSCLFHTYRGTSCPLMPVGIISPSIISLSQFSLHLVSGGMRNHNYVFLNINCSHCSRWMFRLLRRPLLKTTESTADMHWYGRPQVHQSVRC